MEKEGLDKFESRRRSTSLKSSSFEEVKYHPLFDSPLKFIESVNQLEL